MARTINDLLNATVAGETVSDEDIHAIRYTVSDFEITAGTDSWCTCPREQLGAYVDALASLKVRAAAMVPPPPNVDRVAANLTWEIDDLEARAIDAEGCERFTMASALRAKARKLKGQLAALAAKS